VKPAPTQSTKLDWIKKGLETGPHSVQGLDWMKIGSDSLRKVPNLTTKDNRETLSKNETKYLSALFNIIRKKENQKLIFAFLETVFSKIHKSPPFYVEISTTQL